MSDFDDDPIDEPVAPKAAAPAADPVADDDWDDDGDDDAEGGPKRDLTLVYAVVAAAIVIVLAVVLTRPKNDDGDRTASGGKDSTEEPAEAVKNWQGPVGDAVGDKGADAQARAEAAPGVYIWTDFWGWHVRANRPDEIVVTVAAPFVRQKATDDYDDGDEKGDAPFEKSATVTLAPGDGTEGAGFDLGGSESATFTITSGGQNVPAAEIFLGGGEGTADANPVTFTKS